MSDRWKDIGGDTPMLGAFLAGWFLRDMSPRGTQPPDVASFRDSFRVGWREADDQIEIASRSVATPVVFSSDRSCSDGWYWLRRQGEGLIVEVRKMRDYSGGRSCACLAHRGWVPVDEMEGDWQWAGPIPRPIILPPDDQATSCPDCEGRGGHARSPQYGGIKLCPTCNGEGELPNQNKTGVGA